MMLFKMYFHNNFFVDVSQSRIDEIIKNEYICNIFYKDKKIFFTTIQAEQEKSLNEALKYICDIICNNSIRMLNLRNDIKKIKELGNWCMENIGTRKDIKVEIYKVKTENIDLEQLKLTI